MKYSFILKTVLTALLVTTLAGAASAQVSLRFNPEDSSVTLADSTRLGIYLDDAIDVRTLEVTVNYDDTYLNSRDGWIGQAFQDLPGPPPFFWSFDDTSVPGQWSAYVVSVGSESFVTGPGELFYWNVEGVAPGVANITSVSVALYAADGTQISDVTLDPTTLEVVPPIPDPTLDSEPVFTAGLSNTVSWDDVGATEYQVQMSTDPGFASIDGDSGWISGISYEFTGLTHGQIYYYRVKARLASPAYETDWAAGVESSTQDDEAPLSDAGPLDPYQTGYTFDVPWSGSDGTSGLSKVELYVDSGSGFVLYATNNDPGVGAPFEYTAPTEGVYHFSTVAYDGVDNAEAAPVAADASTTVDVTAPSGDLLINGGATITNNPTVTLTTNVIDAVSMRFTNIPGNFSAPESQWQTFAGSLSWDLSAGDGNKTVYAEFQDVAGNIYQTDASIMLDMTPPVDSFVINNDDALTNSTAVTLYNAGSDATHMRFSNVAGNFNAPESAWQPYDATYAWDIGPGEGSHTVYGEYRDLAGNISGDDDSIVLDTIAPTASFVINGDAPLTNSADVTLNSTSADAFDMQFSNDGVTWSGWVGYADSYSWTLAAGEGPKTVMGQYRDEAGNLVAASDEITVDTLAPTASFVINGDAALTNDPEVVLTSTSADAYQMRFSNDGASWSGWVLYEGTYNWTLAAGDGLRTVYGEFRDEAGNETTDDDDITVDTTAPTGSMVINGGALFTNDPNVTLSNAVVGATQMQFSDDGTTWSTLVPFAGTYPWNLGADGAHTVYGRFLDDAGNELVVQDDITLDTVFPVGDFVINNDEPLTNDPAVLLTNSVSGAAEMRFTNTAGDWNDGASIWQSYAVSLSWTLGAGDGSHTVYGQFRDAAGNTIDADDEIMVDATPPTASFVINGDAAMTNVLGVTLNSTSADAITMRFSNDGTNFGPWESFAVSHPWDLDVGEGEQTVYGEYRDEAGNVTEATDVIIVDTIGPDASFVINGDAVYTTDPNVTLTNTVTDAVDMRFRTDGGAWSTWTGYLASYGWFMEGPDGEKTVDGQFRDTAGNVTETSDTIILDVVAPVGSFVINNDDLLTNDTGVELTSSVTGAVDMQFRNEGGAWSGWVGYATLYAWDLVDADGEQTVQGQFRDAAGNITQTEDSITLDRVAPAASFVINGDAPFTNLTAVTLTSSSADAVSMQFSNDGVTYSGWVDFAVSYPWDLGPGEGLRTVYGQFRDAAGNILDALDQITLDSVPPDVPVMTAEPPFTQGAANTVAWSDVGGDGYYAEVATDALFSSVVGNSDWIPGTTFEFGGLGDGLTYYYRVKAKDDLDNETDWSNVVSSTQDATAPMSTAGPLAAYQTSLTFDVPWSGSDDTSGLFSVELFVDDGSGPVSAGFTTAVGSPVPFSYTAAGEGTYSFYTRATDVVGIIEDAPGSPDVATVVDMSGPGASFVINNDDPSTNNSNVMLTNSSSEAVSMQFSNDGTGYSGWVDFAPTYPWDMGPGEGVRTVHGQFRDEAGNVTDATDQITLDTVAPDIPVMVFEPTYTLGLTNTVAWSDVGGDTYYAEVATHPSFGAPVANSGWISGTSFEFTGLTDGQIYYYRVKAQDDLGNETDWSGVIFSTQDNTAPESEAGPLAAYQTGLTFSVPWSGSDGTSGLASVELFVDDGTGPVSAGTTTEVGSPVAFSYIAPGEGTYSFYTRATDVVGLVEDAPGSPDVATEVDLTLPTGTIVINNDDAVTNNPAVTLTLDSADADQMRFRDAGGAWTAWEAYATSRLWTLPSVDGTATVEVEFKDEAGNVFAASDDIELDTTLPEGDLAINGGAVLTSTTEVTLDNTVTGAFEMRFNNDGGGWSEWFTYAASHPWSLTPGDGVKTVNAEFKDEAQNVLVLSDDIELDTTAPEVPVMVAEPEFTAGLTNLVAWSDVGTAEYYAEAATDPGFTSVVANSGWISLLEFNFSGLVDNQIYYYRVKAKDGLDNETAWSGSVFSTQDDTAPAATADPLISHQGSLTFDVAWTGSDAVSGLASVELFVDDGTGFVSAGTTTAVDPPTPISYTAPADGTYAFYVEATDQVGNVEVSSGAAETSTIVDTTAPTGTMVINGDDASTNLYDVTLTSDVIDGVGVEIMRFTNVSGDWSDPASDWMTYAATHPWTLSAGEGLKTVYAEYMDAAGNVLDTSDDITVDTTPPGVPVLAAEPAFTPGTTNTVDWDDTGADSYLAQVSTSPTFDTILADTGWMTDQTHTFEDLVDGQIYYYRVKAKDELGNETDWSPAVFSTQDATPPTSMAGALAPYQGTADIIVSWTGDDAVSGLAEVELWVNDGSGWVSGGQTTEITTPVDFTYTAPAAGTYSFYTTATDVAGNVEAAPGTPDAETIVDFSAPAAAAGLDAEPGLGSVDLSWTNPTEDDLAAVEIWVALWAESGGATAYPEYDDIATEPARPASRAAADAAPEWQQIASLDPAETTFLHGGMPDRGVYYYEVFVRDLAGNYSPPALMGARATNYRLGDFSGDHVINVLDITILGAAYGSVDGGDGYNNIVDVGPTDDNSGLGIPLTDNAIEFEDLTIVALNYDPDKAAVAVSGSDTPSLTWYQLDEHSWVLGLVEPCSNLKALHLAAKLPDGVQVTVEAGSAFTDGFEYFLANIERNGLDAGFAVLGRDAVLPVFGEILKITTSDPVDLSRTVIEVRDPQNKALTFGLSAEPLQVLPTAYRLNNNYPNPFNPQTTIAFDLPHPQNVRLAIYDLRGHLVKELISESMEAGSHTVIWNGTDRSDRRVASGVYFYQIQAGPMRDTKRMLLVK